MQMQLGAVPKLGVPGQEAQCVVHTHKQMWFRLYGTLIHIRLIPIVADVGAAPLPAGSRVCHPCALDRPLHKLRSQCHIAVASHGEGEE